MTGKAQILCADPPWKFSSNSKVKPGRNAMGHYDCMTDAEIAAMPVHEWTEKDALLFLWVTVPMLKRCMAVADQWKGFTYVSALFWDKQIAGTGHWVRNSVEPILIYKRGKFPCPKPAPFTSSLISERRTVHSRKPEALQDRIDEIWPDARKLELFARRTRPGWMCWGNQSNKFD